MSDGKVRLLLFLTIFIVSALPLLAALYFLDSTLKTSLSLGFNAQVVQALEDSAENLKTLRTLDPERHADYRRQFESIQQLQHVYSDPEMIRRGILDSLRIYFGIGFIAAVLVSVVVAVLLSRGIVRAYKNTFDELMTQREKVRYLQEISSWQELAKVRLKQGQYALGNILWMPVKDVMTGIEFQEALIKQRREEQLIFITGHGDIATAVDAMKKGAFNFLAKPLDLATQLAFALVQAGLHRPCLADGGAGQGERGQPQDGSR